MVESSCMFTPRGRRAAKVIGAACCWAAAVSLFITAVVTDADAARFAGFLCMATAVAVTVCIAISRHADLVIAAYDAGRETGRAEVRRLPGQRV